MEVRYLLDREKPESRPLCEECFPEDSREFTDYYYREKCRDNRILAAIDKAEGIVSMVHANPFTVSLFGQRLPVHYIVAVATTASRRRQGLMRDLLGQTLRDCCAEGEAFSFLMPANPAYYEPLGYRYWQNQWVWKLSRAEQVRLTNYISDRSIFPQEIVADQNLFYLSDCAGREAETAEFVNRALASRFDLYVERDAAYYRRLAMEQNSEFGDVILFEKPGTDAGRGKICGCVCYSREGKLEFREPVREEGICAEQRSVLMGRIVSLRRFAECLRFPVTFSDVVRVTDAVIPENNGVFRITVDEKGGCAERISDQSADHTLDIAELGQILFDQIRIFINEVV